jgi:hypothetical protein
MSAGDLVVLVPGAVRTQGIGERPVPGEKGGELVASADEKKEIGERRRRRPAEEGERIMGATVRIWLGSEGRIDRGQQVDAERVFPLQGRRNREGTTEDAGEAESAG